MAFFFKISLVHWIKNSLHEVQVMGSIQDNITDEVLLEEINEIIRLPLYTQHMARDQQEAAQAAHARRR